MRTEFRQALLASCLFVLICGWRAAVAIPLQGPGTRQTMNDGQSATVVCHVVNERNTAVAGAKVELLKRTGNYDAAGVSGTTDAEGNVELTFECSDESLFLHFSADGYASSMRDLQISNGESQQIVFQLSPPVRPWIQVTSDGRPLAGAEVSRIEFTDQNGSRVVPTMNRAADLGFDLSRSDATGRLSLPALPLNARLQVWVVHPNRRTIKLEDLVATNEEVANVELESGVSVTVDFSAGLPDVSGLEGQTASIVMLAASSNSTAPETVRHEFPIRDGKISFTAYPVEYSELQFEMENYFLTPRLMNYPQLRTPELDLSDGQPAEFKMSLRRKVTVRGRVVNAEGEGVSDALVRSFIANSPEANDPEAINSSRNEAGTPVDNQTDSVWASLRHWSWGGSGQTDEEGRFEIRVAAGTVRLEIHRVGYFSSPMQTETVVKGSDHETLADLKVFRVPELLGIVRDEGGQPVTGAIVRLRHTGRGGTPPIGQSSTDGSFRLSMSQIPQTSDGLNLQTAVSVVAIDPGSNRGGIADVDLTNASSTGEIQIILAEQSPDWALNVVQPEASLATEETQAALRERIERFADGTAGNVPPDLSQGTWLNTDARSLKDFHGKFVLLDFWYIGCGPCHRDMPEIKMLHEKFSGENFSVVSIHRDGETPEAVQKFASENGMDYPIVVDTADGEITRQYRPLGVFFYPMYILLGPDGEIIHNDVLAAGPHSLRRDKIEMIYRVLREQAQKRQAGNSLRSR